MINDKLEEIGDKLGVSNNDIKDIRREKRIQKYRYQIIGALISIQSIILGYLIGINSEPRRVDRGGSYPYFFGSGCGICLLSGLASIFGFLYLDKKVSRYLIKNPERRDSFFKKLTIFLTIIISIFGFIITFRIGQPVEYYGMATLYDTYDNKRG